MSTQISDEVATWVLDYYRWLSGHGGRSPEELLALHMSPGDREALLCAMDDVLVVWGLTAPARLRQMPSARKAIGR